MFARLHSALLAAILAAGAAGSAASAQAAEHTNSIGMRFVPIAAGSFTMGSPDGDREADADEKPAHRVTIAKPFLLGKFDRADVVPFERITGFFAVNLKRTASGAA